MIHTMRLRSLVQTGLAYCRDPYDLEQVLICFD